MLSVYVNTTLCSLLSGSEFTIPTGGPQTTTKPSEQTTSLDDTTNMLRDRYIRDFTSNEGEGPGKYVELALVKNEVTRVYKNLERSTKLTSRGQVDELLLKKEQLCDMRDIFCYQSKPCPRLILIIGGPGEY